MTEDELSPESIARNLGTHLLARRVVYLESIGSTNDVAKQLADAGEPEGTLVIADEQTAGRGRRGRTWLAPARSSLLMSLVLRPHIAPAQSAQVTMAVALGTCDAIREQTGLDARLKWFNDILLNEHKCGGILAEAQIVGEEIEHIVVGMGINVNFSVSAVEGLPVDATTLADELGRPIARLPLLQAILRRIEPFYLDVRAGKDLRAAWAARLVTLGRRVRAQTPWGEERGIAESVDADGGLLLRRADRTMVRLLAADVSLHSE